MYGSLVYYLDAGVETLDRIGRKYDPTFRLMRPHVPVLFPVPETVGRGRLLEHLDAVVPRLPRFPVRFRGLDKTPDHWMYLKVEDGSADFVRMYEAVYTGPLAPFRRGDVRFVPHVGLGLFVKKNVRYDISAVPAADSFDELSYRRAWSEADSQEIDFRSTVSRLHFVELEDEVLEWARGERRALPENARARTALQIELAAR